MIAIYSIEKVREAYERALVLGQDHDAACDAAAQALGIAVESVKDAIAISSEAAGA